MTWQKFSRCQRSVGGGVINTIAYDLQVSTTLLFCIHRVKTLEKFASKPTRWIKCRYIVAYFTANQIHTILSDSELCLNVNRLLRRDIIFRALTDGLAFGSLKS